MDRIEMEKQAIRALAAEHLGVDTKHARVFGVQSASLQQLDRILSLPVSATDAEPLQDADGNLFFIWGLSDPFGPDVML